MTLGLLAAALFANSASIPDQIDVGQANWNSFPPLVTEHLAVPNGDMVRRVQLILREDGCEIEGQSPQRFNFDINYAVMLDPRGNASRIVVEDVGCRPLELYVGRIAADIMRSGYVRVTPPAEPTWYAKRINFNLR